MPSASEMKTLDGVYDEMFSFQELYQSYLKARRRKRFRGDVMLFTDRLEENLAALEQELKTGTYRVRKYRRFYVSEPKLRLVMAQQFRDRVVQWAIYRQLMPFYDKMFIEDSYACRLNKGSHKAADRLQYWLEQVERKPGEYYYLKLDISKYFYRVDHEILISILKKRVKDERLMVLLEQIINCETENFGLPLGVSPQDIPTEDWLSDVGMPIGNLSSQLFANIYLNELDQYCKHELHLHFYVRYADDIIILLDSKEKLHKVKDLLKHFNKKTVIRPCRLGVDFVGYRVSAHKRKLKRHTARHMINTIRKLTVNVMEAITERVYLERVTASYKGILDHCDSEGLQKLLNVILLVQKLKFIRLHGRASPAPA